MTRARTRASLVRLSLTGRTATSAALALSAAPAMAHSGDHADTEAARAEFLAEGEPGPSLTSANVSWLGNFPETTGISGDFSVSSEHFYTSSLDTLTVFDISDPKAPTPVGTLPNFVFENEAMNYGEQRTKNGELKNQFIMVGVDIVQGSPTDPQHVNVGGGELIIVDVSTPEAPAITARVPGTTSTHTVACIKRVKCNFAYSAGSGARFSVFDLRDLSNPKEVDSNPAKEGIQPFKSPASGASAAFNGAGHKWNYVGKGLAFHTGSAGTAAFDVSRPLHPKLLTTTNDAAGTPEKATAWNNFIHHNSWLPHAFRYKANAPASLKNGNVLLVTEEDYENPDCSTAGSFQTWRVGNLKDPKSITPLDRVELTDLGGEAEGITPVGAFCSAHWFDYHQSGIAAVAYYNGGVRLIDVRDPKNITSFGFAQGGGETWDAYWVPKRDENKRALLSRTNIFYSVDAVRGLDVYEVTNLPGSRASQKATGGRTAVAQPTSEVDVDGGFVLPIGVIGAYLLTRTLRRRNAHTA